MKAFEINKVSAKDCSKTWGSIKVGELHNADPVAVSFVIIRGANSGPALLITAGISGTGVSAIEAARRVVSRTDPKTLKGTLIVIPVTNMPAFLLRQRYNILENHADPVNLFASFPGNAKTSLTKRMADVISTQFFPKVNYYVDLHNSRSGGRYEPFVVAYPGLVSTDLQDRVIEFAKSFGTKFVTDAGVRGSTPPELAGRPQVAAGLKGVLAIMSECGEEDKLQEEDVEFQFKGILNIMKFLGMLEGKQDSPRIQLSMIETTQLYSNSGGFLDLKVKLGEKVREGQTIVEVSNLFCDCVERIKAPVDGYVTRVTTTLTVGCGDRIGQISICQPM